MPPLMRVMNGAGEPLKLVNEPASAMRPSLCTSTASTKLSSPVPMLMLGSSVPAEVSRMKRLRLTEPKVVKPPPITTAPSPCTAMVLTKLFSSVPAA
jgi:hypothetical protein